GYGSWFEHVQEFWEHRMDANVLFLKYEDMHRDLVTMVEQLARFLGVSCDKAQLESLIEHCHQLVDQCCNAEALPVGREATVVPTAVGAVDLGCFQLPPPKWATSRADALLIRLPTLLSEAFLSDQEKMKRNSVKPNVAKVNSTRSGSTKARDLMHKMSVLPDWHSLYPSIRKLTCSRPHSSPCRVYSKTGFQDLNRPSSSATAIANPILSSLDIERILSQKISNQRDEMKKVFLVLDPTHSQTVTKGELKRAITAFLLPLTREQFQDLLAQIPLTSSGNVPYLEFLSKFGGIDLNINVIRRGNSNEIDYSRTFREFAAQLAEKIFRNTKTIQKAFQLIDVNSTGTVQPRELRRVLETFCLKMRDEEYEMLLKQYNLDGTTTMDYNAFMKNLSESNEVTFKLRPSNS
ncbi:hypothetical protein STEG23_034645, partial [Scotinomys teguina]